MTRAKKTERRSAPPFTQDEITRAFATVIDECDKSVQRLKRKVKALQDRVTWLENKTYEHHGEAP